MVKVKMTQAGYNRKMEQFNKLKDSLKEISKKKVESAYDGSGDTWHDNFSFEQYSIQEESLITRIKIMSEELDNVEILKREELDSDIINLGDKVLIEITYSDGDKEQLSIVLDGDVDEENSVSLDSPLGMVLYKARVNEEYSYVVNGCTNTFIVLKKVKN